MPDWGTKIFDAAGQLHDLSVNAFDSLSSATPHKALAYGGPILSQKFETLYGSYRDKLSEATGIEMPTDVENLSVFGEGLKKSASKAVKLGGQVIIGKVATVVGAEMGGPLAILAGEVLQEGIGAFENWLGMTTMKPGTWIHIDNGFKTVSRQVNRDPKIIEVQHSIGMFGEMIDVPDDIEYAREADISLGFVLGILNEKEYEVFNFKTEAEEQHEKSKLRPCDADTAAKLDANESFSMIREIRFLKDHESALETVLPTEEGDIVWYKDKKCVIAMVEGRDYIVEDEMGNLYEVDALDLKGGKNVSTASWNHKGGKVTATNFIQLTKDALFTGEWVWFKAPERVIEEVKHSNERRRRLKMSEADLQKDDMILGVVRTLANGEAQVVTAYDGISQPIKVDQIVPVNDALSSTLNHSPETKLFLKQTITGEDTKLMPLGTTKPELSLGLGYEHPSPPVKTPEEKLLEPNVLVDKMIAAPGNVHAVAQLNDMVEALKEEGVDIDVSPEFVNFPESSSLGGGSMGALLLFIGVGFVLMNYSSSG